MRITLSVLTMLCFCLCLSVNSQAQVTYHHGAGVGYFFSPNSVTGAGTYAPRLNLATLSDESAIALGAEISLFAAFSASSSGGSAGALIFDMPVHVSYQFGANSTPKSEAGVGGFVGLGYGVSSMAFSSTYAGSAFIGHGPAAIAGFKFRAFQRHFGINASYTYGLGAESGGVIGARLMYYFK